MARKRTGKRLLCQKNQPKNLIDLIILLLQKIGRFSYHLPILTIKSTKIIGLILYKSLTTVFQWIKKRLFYSFLLVFLLISSILFYFYIVRDIPQPNKLLERPPHLSTKIYDRNGILLYTFFDGSQKRTLVKIEEIPDHVIKATLAIEDQAFYKHSGFSISGIVRAFWRNLSNSEIEGGSTITQQLIKNTLLTPERTIERKIKELILSIEIEMLLSKNKILQMYFNEVPYGGTAYGIEEAAQTYFDKSIKEVSLAEAALLAGLPAAPTRFSPFGANPQFAITRQHQVLNRMVEEGYISSEQAEKAKKEKIILAPQTENIKAPHFVMYVKEKLVEEYGQKAVEQGGLQVITSLDYQIQKTAQKIVSEEVAELSQLQVGNGAALVTNPKNGEVLAMVGSKDYFNHKEDGNVNITTALRQPGSSIKVVTYALALENGFQPSTIINDSPITYHSPGSQPYSPLNYDRRFHGNVTLRTALASSYNVPAVKTLAQFGVKKMIDLGEKMGITTWNEPNRYGLSITLGGAEVKMTDMAVVYGTIANYGERKDLSPILKLTDSQGKTLYSNSNSRKKIISKKTAFLLTDILSDNRARTPAFGPSSFLVIPDHQVAVKTGTTNDKRDNWTIGYTRDFLTAVWVGNNDNSPMSAVASGVTGASPIWNKIMVKLLEDKPKHHFPTPDNLVKVKVCSWNGLLPCEGCPTVEEYFTAGEEPKQHCSSEKMKQILEKIKEKNKILEGASTEDNN